MDESGGLESVSVKKGPLENQRFSRGFFLPVRVVGGENRAVEDARGHNRGHRR